jgi:hypothetical protein
MDIGLHLLQSVWLALHWENASLHPIINCYLLPRSVSRHLLNICQVITFFLLTGYQLIRDKKFVWPSDPKTCSGGSVSSWYGRQVKGLGARESVVHGHQFGGWAWGYKPQPGKMCCYETSKVYGGGSWHRTRPTQGCSTRKE